MHSEYGYIMRDQVHNRVTDLMGYSPRNELDDEDGSGEQLPLFSITVVALYLLALATHLN